MGDIAALIAPRPLLVETGALDSLNGERGVANVTEQLAIAGQAYRLLGVPDGLAHDLFEGEHMWHGEYALPWMKQWLAKGNER